MKKLVLETRPAIVVVDADSVDVWFEGALVKHARIEPAFASRRTLPSTRSPAQRTHR